MAVSADEFETSVAAITGCAAGNAPEIGGGGTLVRANSPSSAAAMRAPATTGNSESIAPFSTTKLDRLAAASGPACSASCSMFSAALEAAVRAAASAVVVAGGMIWLAALKSDTAGDTGVAVLSSRTDDVVSSEASSGTSAGDAVVGACGTTVMVSGCDEP